MTNYQSKMPSSAFAKNAPFSQREKVTRQEESKIKRETLSLWERVRVISLSGEGFNNILVLILLSFLLFFFKLGNFSLYDAAETIYGEFVKNILRTGDWLTLRYNAQVIFDKPPLYFWLVAILSWFVGFNEWAMRIPAAMSGVLTVLTTYFLGKKFYNDKVGFYSGLIVMTAFQFLVQSRIAELDILLTLLLTLSLFLFYLGYSTGNRWHYFLMYVPMALSVLIKGLIGIALPGCAIFLFLLFKGELKKIFKMHLIPGILIILIISIPWYAMEYYYYGKLFLNFVLGFLFLSRFQGVVAGHPGPWFYYFISILIGFAPWSQFLPLAFWRSFRNWRNDPELLSLAYIIPAFVVFSAAKTKLPSYLLPLFPFFAIMVGKLWDDLLSEPENKFSAPLISKARINSRFAFIGTANLFAGFQSSMLISLLSLFVVVILIIVAALIAGTTNYQMEYQTFIPVLSFLGIVLFLGSLISFVFFLFKRFQLSFYSIPAISAAVALILIFWALPLAEGFKGTKELAASVAKVIKSGEMIAAYNVGNRPSVVFYNTKPIVFLKDEKELEKFLKNKKGFCFTTVVNLKTAEKYGKIFDRKGELIILY